MSRRPGVVIFSGVGGFTKKVLRKHSVPGSPSQLDQRKQALRAKAAARRRLARQSTNAAVFDAAADIFLREFKKLPGGISGSAIGGYWPIGDEFDPRPLLLRLASQGVGLALPAITEPGTPLSFRSWQPGTPLRPGPLGTSVPEGPDCTDAVIMLLVPLLAFDRRGQRLGFGGGYYDRTLARLRRRPNFQYAIGIGFAAQRVAQVPAGPTDAPLDAILTEQALTWINPARKSTSGQSPDQPPTFF